MYNLTEYLTGETAEAEKDIQPEEVLVKQETEDDKTQEMKQVKEETPRYLTLKELSKSFQTRKRKIIKTPPIKKKFIPNNYVQANTENTVLYVSNSL